MRRYALINKRFHQERNWPRYLSPANIATLCLIQQKCKAGDARSANCGICAEVATCILQYKPLKSHHLACGATLKRIQTRNATSNSEVRIS